MIPPISTLPWPMAEIEFQTMRWFISFPGMLECKTAQRGRGHTLWENNRRFTIELYGQHMSSAPWV